MRVLIVEDLTSGALSLDGTGALDAPGWLELAGEGAAMLQAIAADARDVPGWRVEVLWSRSLGAFPVPGVTAHPTDTPAEERRWFTQLAGEADRTFVIAPEFDRRLEMRRELVEAAGGCFAGSSASALALCGDKLRLGEHLRKCGVATIPTRVLDLEQVGGDLAGSGGMGLVIKPRDGAGAMDTFHVRDADGLRNAARVFDAAATLPIVQPFIAGRAMSVAAIVSSAGIELFPLASQRIEYGEQLTYTGGSVGGIPRDLEIESLVRAALKAVPGLSGYIGVDLIVPEAGRGAVVVEVNPRLTTSYLGYRQLATTNLAPRLLDPDGDHETIRWRAQSVGFTPK